MCENRSREFLDTVGGLEGLFYDHSFCSLSFVPIRSLANESFCPLSPNLKDWRFFFLYTSHKHGRGKCTRDGNATNFVQVVHEIGKPRRGMKTLLGE